MNQIGKIFFAVSLSAGFTEYRDTACGQLPYLGCHIQLHVAGLKHSPLASRTSLPIQGAAFDDCTLSIEIGRADAVVGGQSDEAHSTDVFGVSISAHIISLQQQLRRKSV